MVPVRCEALRLRCTTAVDGVHSALLKTTAIEGLYEGETNVELAEKVWSGLRCVPMNPLRGVESPCGAHCL